MPSRSASLEPDPRSRDGAESEWALRLFRRTARRVPAYDRFLREHGFDPGRVQSIEDFRSVPITTKAEYVRKFAFEAPLVDGALEQAWVVSTSSGSTGKPSYWARGPRDQADAIRVLGPAFEAFGSRRRSTLSLVAFAMGSWLGGTYHLQAMLELRADGHRITTITPGTDVDAAVRVLGELAPRFEQTIIQGYPPLVREILERAAGVGIDLHALDVWLVVSGEPITERWRDYVAELIAADPAERIRSLYGATDIGAIAIETRATIALRRLATKGSRLWNELYGEEAVEAPTLVEYDPRLRHVETERGMLLFTVDGAVPLIRYRIGDVGEVLSPQQLRERVQRALGQQTPALPSRPCIVLRSRVDVAAIFNGANIYPHDIRAGLEHASVRAHLTGKFVLSVREHSETLQPVLELTVECNHRADGEPQLAERVRTAVLDAMTGSNAEYRVIRNSLGAAAEPVIRLVTPGQAEFVIIAKHHWINPDASGAARPD